MVELDTPLRLGEYVDIHFSKSARESTGRALLSCIGLVRWCRREDGLYGGRYSIGMELSSTILLQRKQEGFGLY
jgi:hypothetical protein